MANRGTRHKPEWYLPEIRQYVEKNGPSTSSDIARAIRMSPGGASSVLRKLVEVGYMMRDTEGKGSHPLYWLRGEGDEPETTRTEAVDEDEMIAEAAVMLFGEKFDGLASLFEWIKLTKELMQG